MKIIFLAITAIIVTAGAYAQPDTAMKKLFPPDIDNTNNGMNQNKNNGRNKHPDGYMMQSGKMMMVKDGNMTAMEKNITLANGTMIMSDGTYYMKKGGTKMKFKEGEHMDMMGKMIPMTTSTPEVY